MDSFLKGLRKETKTKPASECLVEVEEFYDTGSYALNRIITGNVYKGIPRGRITTIYGPSQSGKSLIAAHTAANALKRGQIDHVFWIDSEGGGLKILKNYNVDMSKVEYVPVEDAEHACIQATKIFEALIAARKEWEENPDENDEPRVLLVLDSLGMLASTKVVTDAVEKDKMVADQGMQAKVRNAFMRTVCMRSVMSNCSMIIINHEYKDPSQMYPSKVHNMAGGSLAELASHVIIQSSKLMVKGDSTDFFTGKEGTVENSLQGSFKGNRFKFLSVKNREARMGFEAEVYVDQIYGISRYDGIIRPAIDLGFIQEVRGGYIVPSYKETRVTYKELVANDEIWATFLEEFNKKSEELMQYGSKFDEAIAEIEEEVKAKEKQLIVESTSDGNIENKEEN